MEININEHQSDEFYQKYAYHEVYRFLQGFNLFGYFNIFPEMGE